MKKIFTTIILALTLMVFICSANAFFPSGRFNENYSYEHLEIVKEGKYCYLQGTVINETDKRRENISITFYAMTIHDETLWKKKISIDLIDRNGKFSFKTKIKTCNKEPYKWEFKIKDRNK